MPYKPGRHFLQIPGPSNVPDRVLRAMDRPVIDHRSAEFAQLGLECLNGIKSVFQTSNPVVVFPSSGTGAWEAAMTNTLNPGDRILAFEIGQFATLWAKMAGNLGFRVDVIPGDWRHGIRMEELAQALARDSGHEIKAVFAVHNETSTGVTTDIPGVRRTLDEAKHPALLMVDTISSLASIDYRHDEWRVDVAIGGSQKGLMLPPGLAFNALSKRALDANRQSKFPKGYFDWGAMLDNNTRGYFPYTPATNLLYGLRESLLIFQEEGLQAIFARHKKLAQATRCAAQHWGLEMVAADPSEYSNTVTALFVPDGFREQDLRALILEKFNMSLGAGLGKVAGRAFRIGHIGDLNELMLAGTLCGVEMGLELAGIPYRAGGVNAALRYLTTQAKAS
ncbi:MAG: aminotransferase class V-fold PLP-dependent enzyme [Acidobacteriaceae bacterium]|nr:aminotransferase class V-fold PLP-dependent enzyme [Acidobacteriaceae bacterium]